MKHLYVSTACQHEDHGYCAGRQTQDGAAKKAAVCKFCNTPCLCPCHSEKS